MKFTLGGQQLEIKKSSIKFFLLNSNGIIMTTAMSILRYKSVIKANKNRKHSNRKPKNSTRIDFKTKKNYRMKQTLKLPKFFKLHPKTFCV